MSREYTTDEVRDKLIKHIIHLVDYWDGIEKETSKEKLEGLAFSILSMLDGSGELPAFIVAPCPHMDDKEYHQENGENWYAENHNSDVKGDIGGYLHECLHPMRKLMDEKRNRNEKIDSVIKE